MAKRSFNARYLGLISYDSALALQQQLRQARAEGHIPDTLLLLQHMPVFTIGRFLGQADLLVPREALARKGFAVFQTNRGGSVTYHGPGQLVGYPIFNIKELGLGVREYIWKLEEAIIQLLNKYGIAGYRDEKHSAGVWAGSQKICSIGISVSRYITMHGIALNVNNDLKPFSFINPCGIKGGNIMTSMAEQMGREILVKDIIEDIASAFAKTFALNCEEEMGKCLSIINGRNG